jgi:hypothetical protein
LDTAHIFQEGSIENIIQRVQCSIPATATFVDIKNARFKIYKEEMLLPRHASI